MQNTPVRAVFDVITDFLATNPTPEEILAYHMPDELQARVDYLVERNGEGLLTTDEQQELLDFIRSDQIIAMLKIKTKLRLQNQNK